jgi:S1-C subfamily serine protease
MNWHTAVAAVKPHVFKIESPSGHGTGFFCFLNDKEVMGIATALHVVTEADKWQQPIRVTNYELEYTKLLTATDRVVLDDSTRDSAVLLFDPGDFKFPEKILPLMPADKILKIGVEVGWVGFPAVEPNTLCFFSGNISARIKEDNAYLIDGVAINGVSGGPVLQYIPDDAMVIGLITAYIANRATGETLPGLAVAQDVSHIHNVISKLKSLDEAAQKKRQLEEEIQQPKVEPQDPQLPLPDVPLS